MKVLCSGNDNYIVACSYRYKAMMMKTVGYLNKNKQNRIKAWKQMHAYENVLYNRGGITNYCRVVGKVDYPVKLE